MSSPRTETLKYAPLESAADVSFFQELAFQKLNLWGLEQPPKDIAGSFSCSRRTGDVPRLIVTREAFPTHLSETTTTEVAFPECAAPGSLLNVNTTNEFKAVDKNVHLKTCGSRIWEDIVSGAAVDSPSLLLRFTLLSFADIKNHSFVYWFGFPALVPKVATQISARETLLTLLPGSGHRRQLRAGLTALRLAGAAQKTKEAEPRQFCPPFFLVVPPLAATADAGQEVAAVANSSSSSSSSSGSGGGSESSEGAVRVLPLRAFEAMPAAERARCVFAMADPCGVPGVPGWPLRNFLALIGERWGVRTAAVLCYRGALRRLDTRADGQAGGLAGPGLEAGGGGEDDEFSDELSNDCSSLVVHVDLAPTSPPLMRLDREEVSSSVSHALPPRPPPQELPLGVVGWEANSRGKAGPRSMNLAGLMDPLRLMEAAADLNLRLMRWRAIPALDTRLLAATKVLLLGAGTLGCGVARTLLGWGVRHLTFVDNGTVSFSNPTRQCLFEFGDCTGGPRGGGKLKAEAAAQAVKRIYPLVEATAHELTIPMPGHTLESSSAAGAGGVGAGTYAEEAEQWVNSLDDLVSASDVVFLLTDTRESRWLPTLLCASKDKMLIDVALGMDSYLVMRHGAAPTTTTPTTTPTTAPGAAMAAAPPAPPASDDLAAAAAAAAVTAARPQNRLGCYFCNDVVAPQDSTKDRTLDQQCTVTRPGLAPIASALAVELMVALLHHPLKHHAPAWNDVDPSACGRTACGAGATTGAQSSGASSAVGSFDGTFGRLPHQLRGFLSTFGVVQPVAHAFEHCTACNGSVCEAYREQGFQLVRKVCADAGELGRVSGLQAFQKECEELAFDEFDDFDVEDEEGEG